MKGKFWTNFFILASLVLAVPNFREKELQTPSVPPRYLHTFVYAVLTVKHFLLSLCHGIRFKASLKAICFQKTSVAATANYLTNFYSPFFPSNQSPLLALWLGAMEQTMRSP